MSTRAIKARLAQIEAALCPPLVIEVDPDTLPDDYEPNQGQTRPAGSGDTPGSRSIRIFLGGLD